MSYVCHFVLFCNEVVLSIVVVVVVVVVVAVAVTVDEDVGHNYFLVMMYVILMCVGHTCVDMVRGALGFAWYSGLHSSYLVVGIVQVELCT